MELITKKKSYRWNYTVSRENTRKIAESYVEKRSLDLLTSGLKLLNQCIQDNNINTQLNSWDKNHPLVEEVETLWLDVQSSERVALVKALIKHNAQQERIADGLQSITQHLACVLGRINHVLPVQDSGSVVPETKEAVVTVVGETIEPPKKTRKKITARNGFSFEQISGNPEDKKELGKILSAARKSMASPGYPQWTVRDTLLAVDANGLQFEPYRDYSGMVRPPLTMTAIYGIECGGAWPSAKGLHALAEVYKLDRDMIKKIWELIPYCLAKGIKEYCPKDSILFSHLAEAEVESEVASQEEEKFEVTAEIQIPNFVESLGEIAEPVYRTKELKIAVLGMLDHNTARHQLKGFGRHTVVFVDGDKPKSIQPAFYDGVVVLNRVSHTSWELFKERCGNPPQLRFKRNGEHRVNSVNLLRAWFEQYDKGEVEIW